MKALIFLRDRKAHLVTASDNHLGGLLFYLGGMLEVHEREGEEIFCKVNKTFLSRHPEKV
jgi:hypothetical protein